MKFKGEKLTKIADILNRSFFFINRWKYGFFCLLYRFPNKRFPFSDELFHTINPGQLDLGSRDIN